jgi:hypothetical protein
MVRHGGESDTFNKYQQNLKEDTDYAIKQQ